MSDGALKEVTSSYTNSEKQWLAFAFVEIDNLLMDSLEHAGLASFVGDNEEGSELLVKAAMLIVERYRHTIWNRLGFKPEARHSRQKDFQMLGLAVNKPMLRKSLSANFARLV